MFVSNDTHEFFLKEKYWVIETTEGTEYIPRRHCFNSDEIYMFLEGDEITGKRPYLTRGSLFRIEGPYGDWRPFEYTSIAGKSPLTSAMDQVSG